MIWWRAWVDVPLMHGETLAWLIAEQADLAVEIQDTSTMTRMEEHAESPEVRLVISSATPPGDALRMTVEGWLQRFEIQGATLQVEQRNDDAWRTGWRDFFTGRALSPRIGVRPPWETDGDPPAPLTLIIEPGMAFGTGTHETTRGAMKALDAYFAGGIAPTVLDVGSGSGVLSLAAWRLGAARTVGVEIDPVAVENALHNRDLNGATAAQVDLLVGSAADVEGTFDLVLANIIAPILIEIAPEIAAKAGADLILSGMLAHEKDAVLAAYPDFEVVEEAMEGQWVVIRLRRRARG